jgi:hypothetical protein
MTQLLSKAEKNTLSLWITRLTATVYPATHQLVWEIALEILMHHVAKINTDMQLVNIPSIRKEWVKRFLK